ncbi:hypothetical protein [Christiangramia sabulilitoris]|uniref:Uncharacterized protein n=1 Tax=Christiangramia sabulilitoris TaxID=2583991 RepID=A0A550I7K6_9FLAO|nr:hypothetical protein [Christiangramia sabulilitoris]TRO66808.1 hypothetical protein FGM01_02640 [Christiangramia sabulilitoris]
MVLILLIPILLFSFLVYGISKNDKKLGEQDKALTDSSIKLLTFTFLSIIASVIISLQADIPASSGHGGFIYIIIPVISGVAILFLYLISLTIKPRKKIILGVLSIVLNIITGIICSITDF